MGFRLVNHHAIVNKFSAATSPLWFADYETGDLSQFDTTATFNYLPSTPVVQSTIKRSGTYAGQYNVPSGGQRCESVPGGAGAINFHEGDDYWFAMSVCLGSNFDVTRSEFQVVTQWKNFGTGSPPLELKVGNSQWRIDGGFGHPGGSQFWNVNINTATTLEWVDWVFHIHFSVDNTVGMVNAWQNKASVGAWSQVLTNYFPAGGTLYPEVSPGDGVGSYWKMGYYRDSTLTSNSDVYHDSFKLGTTAASVGFTP